MLKLPPVFFFPVGVFFFWFPGNKVRIKPFLFFPFHIVASFTVLSARNLLLLLLGLVLLLGLLVALVAAAAGLGGGLDLWKKLR